MKILKTWWQKLLWSFWCFFPPTKFTAQPARWILESFLDEVRGILSSLWRFLGCMFSIWRNELWLVHVLSYRLWGQCGCHNRSEVLSVQTEGQQKQKVEPQHGKGQTAFNACSVRGSEGKGPALPFLLSKNFMRSLSTWRKIRWTFSVDFVTPTLQNCKHRRVFSRAPAGTAPEPCGPVALRQHLSSTCCSPKLGALRPASLFSSSPQLKGLICVRFSSYTCKSFTAFPSSLVCTTASLTFPFGYSVAF